MKDDIARIWVELSREGNVIYVEPQKVCAVVGDGPTNSVVHIDGQPPILVDGDPKSVMARVMMANLRVAECYTPQIPVGVLRLDAFDEAAEEFGVTGDVIEALLGIAPKSEKKKDKTGTVAPFRKRTDKIDPNDLN